MVRLKMIQLNTVAKLTACACSVKFFPLLLSCFTCLRRSTKRNGGLEQNGIELIIFTQVIRRPLLFPKLKKIIVPFFFCIKIALNSLRAQSLLFVGTRIAVVTSGKNQE